MTTQQAPTRPQASDPTLLRVYLSGRRQYRPITNLVGMQSHQNYTWLLWQNGERTLLPRTLKYMEAKLPAGQFVRLCRDQTVNIDCIERVEHQTYGKMQVWLRSGECIQVSRRRVMPVREQLQVIGHRSSVISNSARIIK